MPTIGMFFGIIITLYFYKCGWASFRKNCRCKFR